ncbi:MAG TPA: Gfo/Idh/MocA family oxidoreductase [Thermoanaerobaculia bacterium]|nr:Gfo/Idh/MocA family oxidoreductase [Thermoanaerobaculia bacterium]
MDYTRHPLGYKLRKVLRYTGLYGPHRTWIKVKSQMRLHRKAADLPEMPASPPAGGHVGILGCGNFAYGNIAYYLRRNYGDVLRGAMDVDLAHAAALYRDYRLRYYTDDAERLISDPEIDLVYVASNHASHAPYAVAALRAGKAVHVEKPHCVDEGQLRELCGAMIETGRPVGLGFNRPGSRLGRLIQERLASQSGAAMLNWFVAGHAIDPDHWYFHEREGGRVLGNLCHWTDFVYRLVPPEGRFPITVHPTRAERSDCDIAVNYLFGDGTIAAITFSAKGHTFEGVRERFAAHKGDVLLALDDFRRLQVEVQAAKTVHRSLFRDHGHQERIRASYEMVRPRGAAAVAGDPVSYVWETGQLFLATRQALEERRQVVVHPFSESF